MSEQTNESHLKNYIKLQMLIKQTCIVLRNLFCQRYEFRYERKWENVADRGGEFVTGFGRDVYKNARKDQKRRLEKGDINNFDVTTLCQLLQAIDVRSLENKKIKDIVEVRNSLAHHATQEIDVNEFESLWQKLGTALVFFGFSDVKLKELYATESIDGINLANPKVINPQNMTEANKLKEKANNAFKNQNFSESINLYCDAIELPDLSEDLLAILYSNRSSAYLKLSKRDEDNIQKARDDAKLAINCRPSWWKAYYRLGCVYEAKRKLDKAIVAYNKALSLDPSQSQIRSARDGCVYELSIMERKEHLDPDKMPLSRDESIKKINKRTGTFNISSDEMKKGMNMARKTGDPSLIAAADVYLAHHYLTGMDDVPQSYEYAAKLFAKAAAAGNAEAIYNLALLTKHGQGVKRDIPEAVRLLHQAAALPPKMMMGLTNVGVAEAQHALGLSYDDGVGVDPIPVMALHWYEKSFENGCSGAANNLGLIYAHGKGVKANMERAIQYWKSAASGGNVLAMESLEEYYLRVLEFKQAKHWWQCALDNGSVTATQRKEMHVANESMCHSDISDSRNDWKIWKKSIDEIALRISNKSNPSGSGFSSSPDLPKLFESARKGSITAQKLVVAFDHFIKGMELFKTKNKKTTVKMIHEFAEAYRIENIVPRWEPKVMEELKRLIESHLKTSVTQQPNEFELDLRTCYISLRFNAMNEMLQFAEVSIKRFPNELYFYKTQLCIFGFLERYPEGLRKANLSLKRFPDCVPLLYDRAVHTRLSNDKPQETIDAYNSFLAIAPRDHRKVPECYYVIALCYKRLKDDESSEKYYNLGLNSEGNQLPCFLPYKSTSKDILTNIHRMSAHLQKLESSSSATTSNKTISNRKTDINVPTKKPKPSMTQLTDPFRVQLTMAHREWISAIVSNKNNIEIKHSSVKGHRTQRSPANLIGLKPITFKEMDITKDHVYEGFVLQVTNIEDAGVGSSVKLLLTDENHDFQRCSVYDYTNICSANEIQTKLGFGSSYSILNPYMRIAQDLKPGIRIDDPRSIIINSTANQSKKCRFCLTVDDNLRLCARCKRVWYCSKECQNYDWKLLKHKLICTPI